MSYERPDTLLIILGAGASFDCLPAGIRGDTRVSADHLPDLALDAARPPLTQQLASARHLTNWILNRWPSARPVIDYLRRNLDEKDSDDPALTLEHTLRDYQAWGDREPEVKRHLLAVRFYLRDLLWATTSYMMSSDLTGGITNHVTLVNHAMRWSTQGNRDVIIVSFNYDLLLEHAVASWSKFNIADMRSYLSNKRLSILKPHGSVQWHWTLPEQQRHSTSLHGHGINSIEAVLEGHNPEVFRNLECLAYAPYDYAGDSGAVSRPIHIPALALPVDGKSEFIWPDEQGARLISLSGGGVSRMLTIGWRAMEKHFLDMLSPVLRADAKTLVVTGGKLSLDEADEAMDRLQQATHANSTAKHVRPENWRRFGDGFTELMRNSKELRWLLDD